MDTISLDGCTTNKKSNQLISVTFSMKTSKAMTPGILCLAILLAGASSSVRVEGNSRGIPIPYYRFKLWDDLDDMARQQAATLNYVKKTWNVPGEAAIEELSYSSIADGNPARGNAVGGLGFDEDVWDCYSNHYSDYDWDELVEEPDFNVRQYFERLGWTEKSWEDDDPPAADDEDWADLSSDEQDALTELCYVQELWDGIALDEWDELPQAPPEDTTDPPTTAPSPVPSSLSSPSSANPTPVPNPLPTLEPSTMEPLSPAAPSLASTKEFPDKKSLPPSLSTKDDTAKLFVDDFASSFGGPGRGDLKRKRLRARGRRASVFTRHM